MPDIKLTFAYQPEFDTDTEGGISDLTYLATYGGRQTVYTDLTNAFPFKGDRDSCCTHIYEGWYVYSKYFVNKYSYTLFC